MDFIVGEKQPGCVFCNALHAGPARHAEFLVLAEAPRVFVIVNRYPYAHGHLMVVPRRHVASLGVLDAAERADLLDATILAEEALRATMSPQGLNVGMNLGQVAGAGIADHIHIHLVPRWSGDTNFMPILADTRVMPEHLEQTWQTLRPAFADFAARLGERRP